VASCLRTIMVCVCVCVCVREREREQMMRHKIDTELPMILIKIIYILCDQCEKSNYIYINVILGIILRLRYIWST
jgi:hypothetical protein